MTTRPNYRALPDVASPQSIEEDLKPVLSAPSVHETEFAEIEDGSLIELIEDPEDSSKSALAVYEAGKVRIASRVPSGGRVLVPIPRNRHMVKQLRLPRGIEPCESAISLLAPIQSIFARCLDLDQEYRFLLATFVLSSWFIEQLPVAPYVALIGLPGSGKTRALSLLRLLCRRGLLTGDITPASLYRVCDLSRPTLLIDEVDSARDQQALFHFLRAGTVRDSVIFRKDESFSIFGAKAFSLAELPDDAALNSRCVVIPLRQERRGDLKSWSDPEIVQAADDLQKRLLYLRLDRYKKLTLPKMDDDDIFRSRGRDIYEALALSIGEDRPLRKRLRETLRAQDENNREPLGAKQSAVLGVLFLFIHNFEEPTFTVGDFASYLNRTVRAAGERFLLADREVGAILGSLGFAKKRTCTGYQLLLDIDLRKRVHDLVSTHGLDNRKYFTHINLAVNQVLGRCELCRVKGFKD